MDVHGPGAPPDPVVRVFGDPGDAPRLDLEPLHLHAGALLVARQGADVVDEVPGVVPVQVVAHRHGRAGQPGHDPAVDRLRGRVPLEHPDGQVARARGQPLLVDLLLRPVPPRRPPVAARAPVREQGVRARPGLGRIRRLRRDAEHPLAGETLHPVRVLVRTDGDRRLRERLDVMHEAPPRPLRQVRPGGHGRPRHPPRDRAEEVLVRRDTVPRGDQPVLRGHEVPGPRIQQVGRLPVPPALRPVTGHTLLLVGRLAQRQQFRRGGQDRRRRPGRRSGLAGDRGDAWRAGHRSRNRCGPGRLPITGCADGQEQPCCDGLRPEHLHDDASSSEERAVSDE